MRSRGGGIDGLGHQCSKSLPLPAAPRRVDSPHASVSLQDAARENHPTFALSVGRSLSTTGRYIISQTVLSLFHTENKSTKFITILLTFLSIWLLKSIEFKTQAAKA